MTATLLTVLVVAALAVIPLGALAGVDSASTVRNDASGDGVRADLDAATGETVSVTATPASIAAGVGDRITLTGTASVDSLRLYLIGPRGRFLDATGADPAVEELTVDAGAFTQNYTAVDRRGSFTLLVVSPHDDGAFETTKTLGEEALPTGVTQDQAVVRVLSAYSGDEVLELTLYGESPRLSVDAVDADGVVEYGTEATVSGGSNRGDGTTVTLTLRDGTSRSVVETEATVDAASSEWSAPLDTSALEPGSYTLDADDGVSLTSTIVVVTAEDTVTPSETPVESADGRNAADGRGDERMGDGTPVDGADGDERVENVSQAALENGTEGLDNASAVAGGGNETTNATNTTGDATTNATNATNSSAAGDGETNESLPGFGVGAAVGAIVVAALLVSQRRDS